MAINKDEFLRVQKVERQINDARYAGAGVIAAIIVSDTEPATSVGWIKPTDD